VVTSVEKETTGAKVVDIWYSSSLGGVIHSICSSRSSLGGEIVVGVVEPCFEFESLSFGGEKNDIEVISQAASSGSVVASLRKFLRFSRWSFIGAVDLRVVVAF
jgi:hypothetical protein